MSIGDVCLMESAKKYRAKPVKATPQGFRHQFRHFGCVLLRFPPGPQAQRKPILRSFPNSCLRFLGKFWKNLKSKILHKTSKNRSP